MAEIVARFADGRLLVQEDKAIETDYASGGIPFRIGLVRTVERVLSIDAQLSGYPEFPIAVPLKEVLISGNTIIPILRRADFLGQDSLSGLYTKIHSGYASRGVLSGIVQSGSAYGSELTSSLSSGRINIVANVIGH